MNWQHILVWALFMAAGSFWTMFFIIFLRERKKKAAGTHRG